MQLLSHCHGLLLCCRLVDLGFAKHLLNKGGLHRRPLLLRGRRCKLPTTTPLRRHGRKLRLRLPRCYCWRLPRSRRLRLPGPSLVCGSLRAWHLPHSARRIDGTGTVLCRRSLHHDLAGIGRTPELVWPPGGVGLRSILTSSLTGPTSGDSDLWCLPLILILLLRGRRLQPTSRLLRLPAVCSTAILQPVASPGAPPGSWSTQTTLQKGHGLGLLSIAAAEGVYSAASYEQQSSQADVEVCSRHW
mmetsp:Transcript_31750/g.69387  ORF Transcript_31750/g.69387 Transcript_31750/m.69387 type:complete len:245 (-) Transcript_31750:41-775(-)